MSSAPPVKETGSRLPTRYDAIARKIEVVVVTSLQVLIVATATIATALLFVLFVNSLRTRVTRIESVDTLLPAMQKVFSGVLVVLVGLELLETVRTYFSERIVRVEVIIVVAIIAVGRHIIQIDFGELDGAQLLGLGALMAALAMSYFLVRKAHARPPPANPARRPPNGSNA